jgi:Putative bacterial sensory transduction regulator
MRSLVMIAVCGCFLLATPAPSNAQDEQRAPGGVISRIQPDDLAAILTAAGYRSEVQSDNSGKYVATTMSGYSVLVFPYDCKAQGCSSIQFWTGFSADPALDLEFANAWNTQWRFAKANLDVQGNFIFTSDVFLDGGVTAENIKASAGLFDYLLGELNQFNP